LSDLIRILRHSDSTSSFQDNDESSIGRVKPPPLAAEFRDHWSHSFTGIGFPGHPQLTAKGQRMLGKVLGLATAGVFIGAAVVEICGCVVRGPAGKEPSLPQATNEDFEGDKGHDQTAPQAEG
jgi:hypothetical protein